MRLIVEINLETVISLQDKTDAEVLAIAQGIKDNWFEFAKANRSSFKINTYCELA